MSKLKKQLDFEHSCSIERTPKSQLRCLLVAAHVER